MSVRLRSAVLASSLVLALAGGATAAARPSVPAARAQAAASSARVPILLFHHIAPAPSGTSSPALWTSPARFGQIVDALARAGYRGVTLDQVTAAWRGEGTLPRRPVVLSFDDGYGGQATRAAPVLARRGWPGVLYLWLDRLGIPGGLSDGQVRGLLDDGWELGGHTRTHRDLTALDAAQLSDEVAGSRSDMLELFDVAVDDFAYPYGRQDAAVRAAVTAAGYRTATTTHRGLASAGRDRLQLPRVIVNGRRPASALLSDLRRLG